MDKIFHKYGLAVLLLFLLFIVLSFGNYVMSGGQALSSLFSKFQLAQVSQGVPISPLAAKTLVIYNASYVGDEDKDGVQDSLEVAQYYMQKRGIPSANLFGITCPIGYGCSSTGVNAGDAFTQEYGNYADLQTYFLGPLRDKLNQLGQTNIDILVMSYMTPFSLGGSSYGNLSLDDMLIAPFYWSTTTQNVGKTANPYFTANPSFSTDKGRFDHSKYKVGNTNMYLVGRLDGAVGLNAVLNMIDQDLYADRYFVNQSGYFNGKAYINSRTAAYTDSGLAASSNVRNGYYNSYSAASENIAYTEHHLTQAGMPFEWDNASDDIGTAGVWRGQFNDGTSAITAKRVFMYAGWYKLAYDQWDWLPGSYANDLNSSSLTLRPTFEGPQTNQNAIKSGVSNISGVVNEPYVDGHPQSNTAAYYLLKGYSFAEASILSYNYLGWMHISIGDPLYAPFAPKTLVKDTIQPVLVSGYPNVSQGANTNDRIVNLMVSDNPEPEAVQAQIEYGLDATYGNKANSGGSTALNNLNNPYNSLPGGYFRRLAVTLPNLQSGATYHFRARLTDPVGNTTLTGDYTFNTSNNAVSGPVPNSYVTPLVSGLVGVRGTWSCCGSPTLYDLFSVTTPGKFRMLSANIGNGDGDIVAFFDLKNDPNELWQVAYQGGLNFSGDTYLTSTAAVPRTYLNGQFTENTSARVKIVHNALLQGMPYTTTYTVYPSGLVATEYLINNNTSNAVTFADVRYQLGTSQKNAITRLNSCASWAQIYGDGASLPPFSAVQDIIQSKYFQKTWCAGNVGWGDGDGYTLPRGATERVIIYYMLQPDATVLNSDTAINAYDSDFKNPATLVFAIGSANTADSEDSNSDGYIEGEGAYGITSVNNVASFTIDGSAIVRHSPAFKVASFGGSDVQIRKDGVLLTSGVNYIAAKLNSSTLLVQYLGNIATNASFEISTAGAVINNPPTILSFSASPSSVTPGTPATLSWSVSGATSLSIDNGVGDVTGLSSKSVSPTVTTTYTLTATNDFGSDTGTAKVTVLSSDTTPPSTPQNLSAVAVSPNQINLSWTASTDDVAVAGYKISRDSVWVANTVSPGFQDTSLSPNTTYIYRVSAYDAAGNISAESLSSSATTLAAPDTTPPTISSISVTSVDSSSATIVWGTNEPSSSFVDYGLDTNYSNMADDLSLTTSHTMLLSNLSPGTTYHFRVRSSDAVGNESSSGDQTFTTLNTPPPPLSDTPPSAVATLSTSQPGSTYITLRWKAPGNDGSVGTAASYDIRYSLSQITESNWSTATQVSGEPAPKLSGTSQTYKVTGLKVNTAYYFAIKTTDTSGKVSDLSNVASGATKRK